MKLLVLRSNIRKNGYTQYITDKLVAGAKDCDGSITDINLADKKINHCSGCYHCWLKDPGHCVHNDDMEKILQAFLDADVILCATPLYHYSMSSILKKFFERTLPLTAPGFGITPRGYMRNQIRYEDQWRGKKLAWLAVGAFRNPGNYDGLEKTFELLCEGINVEFAGRCIRPEAYLLQFALAKPKTIKKIETGLYQAGRELMLQGSFSEETIRKVGLPLASDKEHFEKYSSIYWEHIKNSGAKDLSLEEIQKLVLTDVRILMSEMARSFDPVGASRIKAVLQFDFPDKDLHYTFDINKGSCTFTNTERDDCDLRVTADTQTWAKAFTKEINMRDALLQKKIQLSGDKSLFMRLERYFPPPSS